jgi:hypothetical protein
MPGWADAQRFTWSAASIEEPLETDRDSFTPATTLAGPGLNIVESSYSFIENASRRDGHSLPELLLRRGITPWLEMRLGYNWESGGTSNPISGEEFDEENFSSEPESRVIYGGKLQTTVPDGWIPRSALIVEATTPVDRPATDTNISASQVFGWVLPNRWVWDSSFRFSSSSDEYESFTLWAGSSVIKIPLDERWNAHLEGFGTFSDDKDRAMCRYYFSPGLHATLNPNLEVGVRVGWGLNQQSADFFANVGLGVRF